MNFNKVKKEIKGEVGTEIIELFSQTYAKILDIPIEDAKKIVSAKFCKHVEQFSDKVETSLTANIIKENRNKDKDISLDEYLENNKVIKG